LEVLLGPEPSPTPARPIDLQVVGGNGVSDSQDDVSMDTGNLTARYITRRRASSPDTMACVEDTERG
jgi:hypothetical protein